jgi:hypothetical protein
MQIQHGLLSVAQREMSSVPAASAYTCRYEYSASSVLHFRWMLQGARQLRALLQYDPALCKYSFFLYILCLSVHTFLPCVYKLSYPMSSTYLYFLCKYFTAGTSMCIYSPVLCIPILHCSVHLPILFFCVHTKMLCVYIFIYTYFSSVLRIRFRSDPYHVPESGSLSYSNEYNKSD